MTDDNNLIAMRRWRRRARWTWAALAGLVVLAFAAVFVMAATDDDDNIALSQNKVTRTATGARTWRGTFWNHSDSRYTQLDAVVLFVDVAGKPVGQARGGAARLDPGETFHLQAALPAAAARMQVYQLRWRREGGPRAALGPYRTWPFGYVTDRECGETRLKLGSCRPQREEDRQSCHCVADPMVAKSPARVTGDYGGSTPGEREPICRSPGHLPSREAACPIRPKSTPGTVSIRG